MTNDITKTRAKNARVLLASCRSNAEFADKVGISRTQVSVYVGRNASGKIGNKIASRMESAFHKHAGWLDIDHDTNEFETIHIHKAADCTVHFIRLLEQEGMIETNMDDSNLHGLLEFLLAHSAGLASINRQNIGYLIIKHQIKKL